MTETKLSRVGTQKTDAAVNDSPEGLQLQDYSKDADDSELEDEWANRFKSNFTSGQLQRRSTIQLASAIQVIYHTLIALAAVAKQNAEEFDKDKEGFYEIGGDLKEACHEKKETDVDAKAFIAENPDFAVENFQLSSSDKIKITEYAPKVFR